MEYAFLAVRCGCSEVVDIRLTFKWPSCGWSPNLTRLHFREISFVPKLIQNSDFKPFIMIQPFCGNFSDLICLLTLLSGNQWIENVFFPFVNSFYCNWNHSLTWQQPFFCGELFTWFPASRYPSRKDGALTTTKHNSASWLLLLILCWAVRYK